MFQNEHDDRIKLDLYVHIVDEIAVKNTHSNKHTHIYNR